jgi:hypothetical protein
MMKMHACMSQRKQNKAGLQQFLMNLEILERWPHDLITLVVDYCWTGGLERLLLMGLASAPNFEVTPTLWSLPIESLYHLLSTDNRETKNNNSYNNSSTSSGVDIQWVHHDIHSKYHLATSQEPNIVMMYDYDNDRIIVAGGDTNSFINWNDIQNNTNTVTMTDGGSSTINNTLNSPCNDAKRMDNDISKSTNDTSLLHSLTPMPTSRYSMLHTTLSGNRSDECILIGGNRLIPPRFGLQVEVYNIATDKWSTLPDLIPHMDSGSAVEPTLYTAACGVDPRNGRIYVFGGARESYGLIKAYNTVEYYDPITMKWETLSVKMKRKRNGPAAIWLPTINSFLITGGSPSIPQEGWSLDEYDEDDYDPIDGHLYRPEECQSMEIYSPDPNTFTLLSSSWSIPQPQGIYLQTHRLHLIDDRFLIIMYHSSPGTCPNQKNNRKHTFFFICAICAQMM